MTKKQKKELIKAVLGFITVTITYDLVFILLFIK